jgi:hypothetical protein
MVSIVLREVITEFIRCNLTVQGELDGRCWQSVEATRGPKVIWIATSRGLRCSQAPLRCRGWQVDRRCEGEFATDVSDEHVAGLLEALPTPLKFGAEGL